MPRPDMSSSAARSPLSLDILAIAAPLILSISPITNCVDDREEFNSNEATSRRRMLEYKVMRRVDINRSINVEHLRTYNIVIQGSTVWHNSIIDRGFSNCCRSN